MKKSLKELVTPTTDESTPNNNFGAFTDVEGGQAKIDLDHLRGHEVFFATPCYGGIRIFYQCLNCLKRLCSMVFLLELQPCVMKV